LYLVGDHYSPPDFAFYGWAKALYALDIDIKSWPLVNQWFEKLDSLPEIKKGLAVPEK
jgi:glutathione S-transferase